MTVTTDLRVLELKLLGNLADGTWSDGLSTADPVQTEALGLTRQMYADMILTLFEDGYLDTSAERLRSVLSNQYGRAKAGRDWALKPLMDFADYYDVTVTYRGLRHIEELRSSLDVTVY